MAIRGIKPKKKVDEGADPKRIAEGLLSVPAILKEVQSIQDDIILVVDKELEKMDAKLAEVESASAAGVKKIDDKVAEFESTAIGLIKDIQRLPHVKGEPGRDADEEKILQGVLDRIPVRDERKITSNILSLIPTPREIDLQEFERNLLAKIPRTKTNLKVLQQNIESDPMSIIDRILSLPEGQFKLKTSHIDGLDQTIRALQHQLGTGRGGAYLHGGGDTIVAGTNITITTNPNGTKTISATGGGGGSGTVTTVSIVTANGISGSVANPTTTPTITLDISALDASKIANGAVSNAEFQYLDGVTSAIQTQINTKQATLVSGTNIKTINSTSLLGSGNISISATPGGSDTQVQFNDGGIFGGDAGFTWDKTSKRITLIQSTYEARFTPIGVFGNCSDVNTQFPELYIPGNEINLDFSNPATGTDAGGNINISSGTGGATSGAGGNISFTAGSAQAGDSNGGNVVLLAGSKAGVGTKGVIKIQDGGSTVNAVLDTATLLASDKTFTFPNITGTFVLSTPNAGVADDVTITAGNSSTAATEGGDMNLTAGNGATSGSGGDIGVVAGDGGLTGAGGTLTFLGGAGGATSGNGGTITIAAGSAIGGNSNGGDIILEAGSKSGAGTVGVVKITDVNSGVSAIFNTATYLSANRIFSFPDTAGAFVVNAARADLTGQTAAKSATTLFTPVITGFYRISVYLQVTTAGSVSSVLGGGTGVVITYNDGDGNVAQTDTMALQSPAGTIVNFLNTNNTATNLSGDMVIYAKTGVAIQYAIGYTSAGTAMVFSAHLRCELIT